MLPTQPMLHIIIISSELKLYCVISTISVAVIWGVKQSGFGRFGGAEGLRACCLIKAVVEDRWWSFIKTVIPKSLQVILENLS